MRENKLKRNVLLGWFMLLVCCAISLQAQEPAGAPGRPASGERRRPRTEAAVTYDRAAAAEATTQPLNSVRVLIRYKKEYGYKSESGAFGGTGPTSCAAFSVLAATTAATRPGRRITYTSNEQMTEQHGYYFCEFLASELPVDQEIRINANLVDGREVPTEAWRGGEQSQPPAGWWRTIDEGSRTITLSAAQPRATMAFEMVYKPKPLRTSPASPLIRKP